jgi:hypothetical protein
LKWENHQNASQFVAAFKKAIVTELIERMVSHALNPWIECGIDYLAVSWRIKTLCEEEKVPLHT